ncbi:MAG TPA: SNF2-related protein, partial [Polyangia bacterium]|nr:SNF2-related protein [Polyangia bacterium]
MGQVLPPALGYWRDFAARFVTGLCTQPEVAERHTHVPAPAASELAELALCGPAMAGAEYLTPDVLAALWNDLTDAFTVELKESGAAVQDFLKQLNPAWNLVGRVHFNLAENRKDPEAPFAFMATYTSRLSSHGKAQHLPLGQALREYAGASNKQRLLSLLLPVQRAAETCAWLRHMVDAGEIFHPLRWTPDEAFRLLGDAAALESAGVVLRMPAGWKASRPPRPQVTAIVGGKPAVGVGKDALLDFRMQVTLDGESLTESELRQLLDASSGLCMVRGRWVEIDRERLEAMMQQYRKAEQLAAGGGMTFAEAMRLLSGADTADDDVVTDADHDWSRVVAGPWLAELLKGLRQPEGLACVEPGRALHGTLRSYQQVGLRWLHLLSKLGLGACLADDMGLGKTIQVLALLLVRKTERTEPQRPSLLVAPASLLANWAAEIERFAPSLNALVAHPSSMPAAELKALPAKRLASVDLVITSYGSLLRLPWLADTRWRLVVVDEAQAIKNPGAKQTRAAKSLNCDARIALTGTPVENRLSDLWSIFDFINPGLLGSAKTFSTYAKSLED